MHAGYGLKPNRVIQILPDHDMRAYLWVVLMFFGLMGAYLALVPITAWSDAKPTAASTGPF